MMDERNKQVKKAVALGTARQKAGKDHMMSTHGIEDGRLIVCAPQHDRKRDAKPRVELII